MSHPISVKGVLLVDRRVVLVKNSRDEWELPGGRLEPGEDHARALRREFLEELSLAVSVAQHIDSYPFEVVPGQRVRIMTYGCTLDGEFNPLLSEEHVEHCLWPVDRLSEINLPEGYRRSAEKWATGRISSGADPSWAATRDDLRRLAWVLALVWLALAAFTALAQRYLGWRLAVGVVGGAGLLFTLGLLVVAAGSVAAASLERRNWRVKTPSTGGCTSDGAAPDAGPPPRRRTI